MRSMAFWLGWSLLFWCTLTVVYSVTVGNSPVVTPMQQAAALTGAASLAAAFASNRRRPSRSIRRSA